MSLTGKTILITGAAAGLGRALALQCANDGANLILLDKNRGGLGRLSDQVVALDGAPPGLYPMDLAGAGADDFTNLVNVITTEFGDLHALIHCAHDFDGLQPLDQIEPHRWLESMQVNVNAPWLLTCACLPLLKLSKNSRLFFLLDDLEMVSSAYWGAYGTGKSALAGLVRQFDEELSNTEISVRGIDPGAMRTAFRAAVYHSENPEQQPEPEIAAAIIANMLTGDISDKALMISLSG